MVFVSVSVSTCSWLAPGAHVVDAHAPTATLVLFVQADKQLRPSPAGNSGPNVRDVIKVVDTKHQQTMETLMMEFAKMAKRFDSLANRLDDIDARTSKRGCC